MLSFMCGYYVIVYFVKLNTAQVQVLTYRFLTKYKQVVIQVTLICFLDSNLKTNFDFVLNGIESFVCVFYPYYAITTLYSPMTYCINSLAIFNFHKNRPTFTSLLNTCKLYRELYRRIQEQDSEKNSMCLR